MSRQRQIYSRENSGSHAILNLGLHAILIALVAPLLSSRKRKFGVFFIAKPLATESAYEFPVGDSIAKGHET